MLLGVAGPIGAAQRLLKTERFDLCLTDMRLPDGDGLDLVKWIQQYSASVPVAVITAHGNMETAVRALKLGAFDFVSKPLDLSEFAQAGGDRHQAFRWQRWQRHERVRATFVGKFSDHATLARDDRARGA